MIALSVPLTLAVVLAFVAWRDWLTLQRPSAPSEEQAARLKVLEDRLHTLEAWGNLKRVEPGDGGPFGG